MAKTKYSVDPFQALSDPSRRQILALLSKNRSSINTLAENFDMSRPAISKHVKILCNAGFIGVEVSGREHFCSLKKDGFDLLMDWIGYYEHFWDQKKTALEKLLEKKNASKKTSSPKKD